MKYVIIRDDDICFFTSPKELELVYRPLLEENKPVNLAVIPIVDTLLGEPFVKRRIPNIRYANIEWNKDLVEFIKQYNFEVLQHGLTHTVFQRIPRFIPEFRLRDKAELLRRVKLGMKILTNTFGRKPRFFVPPWDVLSGEGYEVVAESYNGVILASMSYSQKEVLNRFLEFIPRNLPAKYIPFFFVSRLRDNNYCILDNRVLVLEHKGLCVTPEIDEKTLFSMFKSFTQKWHVVVIVNHHWLLSSDMKLLNVWHRLLKHLLADNKIEVTVISEVYKFLVSRGF